MFAIAASDLACLADHIRTASLCVVQLGRVCLHCCGPVVAIAKRRDRQRNTLYAEARGMRAPTKPIEMRSSSDI